MGNVAGGVISQVQGKSFVDLPVVPHPRLISPITVDICRGHGRVCLSVWSIIDVSILSLSVANPERPPENNSPLARS